MKNIKINRNILFGKKKAEVMQTYNLSEEEYYFIHRKGLQRDANHKVLDDWEVEVPDNLCGHTNLLENQVKTPCLNNNEVRYLKASHNQQQQGFPLDFQPIHEPQPMISPQQDCHDMTQWYMKESSKFMTEVEQRRNAPGYTKEQCKQDIAKIESYNRKLNKCMNATEQPHCNQVTTVMNYGRSTTNVTANNTPMVNMYMTVDMIDKGIDLLSKLTESLGTLARTIEAIANVIAMFKKRDSN